MLLQKHDILFCWSKTKFKSTKRNHFQMRRFAENGASQKKNVFVVQRQNWSWKTKLNLAKRNHFEIRRFAKKWCKPKILHFLLFCCKTKLNSTIVSTFYKKCCKPEISILFIVWNEVFAIKRERQNLIYHFGLKGKMFFSNLRVWKLSKVDFFLQI